MTLSDYVSHEDVDRKIEIEEAIRRLGHIDRAILYLYVIGHTQQEIADILGYSRGQISKLLYKMNEKQQL